MLVRTRNPSTVYPKPRSQTDILACQIDLKPLEAAKTKPQESTSRFLEIRIESPRAIGTLVVTPN